MYRGATHACLQLKQCYSERSAHSAGPSRDLSVAGLFFRLIVFLCMYFIGCLRDRWYDGLGEGCFGYVFLWPGQNGTTLSALPLNLTFVVSEMWDILGGPGSLWKRFLGPIPFHLLWTLSRFMGPSRSCFLPLLRPATPKGDDFVGLLLKRWLWRSSTKICRF